MSTATSQVQDARHVPLSNVDKLRQDAHAAAEVRALQTHPDVVALRVERVRSQVDGLMWAGLLLGLAFTMVNVQTFAAAGAGIGSLPWLAAWLLDPMVSLVLIAVLRAEQVTARYQVGTGAWVRRTKVFAFLATYTMNTWQSWSHLNVAGIVLHSVPPAMVYLAAETGPILRDRLTEAVLRAAAITRPDAPTTDPIPAVQVPAQQQASSTTRPVRTRGATRKATTRPNGRKLLADYVNEARAHLTPDTEITPAWVRQVLPGCVRGTSQNVANQLKAERATKATDTADLSSELQGRAA